MIKCPYPETIIDESSNSVVPSDKYKLWQEGYNARNMEILHSVEILNALATMYSKGIARNKPASEIAAIQLELIEQKNKLKERRYEAGRTRKIS